MQTENGKSTMILSNLNKHLEQLKVDFIDNAKIKKDLHLNKSGKNKLQLII